MKVNFKHDLPNTLTPDQFLPKEVRRRRGSVHSSSVTVSERAPLTDTVSSNSSRSTGGEKHSVVASSHPRNENMEVGADIVAACQFMNQHKKWRKSFPTARDEDNTSSGGSCVISSIETPGLRAVRAANKFSSDPIRALGTTEGWKTYMKELEECFSPGISPSTTRQPAVGSETSSPSPASATWPKIAELLVSRGRHLNTYHPTLATSKYCNSSSSDKKKKEVTETAAASVNSDSHWTCSGGGGNSPQSTTTRGDSSASSSPRSTSPILPKFKQQQQDSLHLKELRGHGPPPPVVGGETTTTVPMMRKAIVGFKSLQQNKIAHRLGTLVKFGTSSYLDPADGVLYHIWASPESAVSFYQTWNRFFNTVWNYRIEGFHGCPSVTYSVQGFYVSVIALPPLLKDSLETTTFATTATDTGKEVINGSAATPAGADEAIHSSYGSFQASLLFRAMEANTPPPVSSAAGTNNNDSSTSSILTHTLTLHKTRDGLLYITDISQLFPPEVVVGPTTGTAHGTGSHVRSELIQLRQERLLLVATTSSSATAPGSCTKKTTTTAEGAPSSEFPASSWVEELLKDVAIPKAVGELTGLLLKHAATGAGGQKPGDTVVAVDSVGNASIAGLSALELVNEGTLKTILHKHGVNLALLNWVRLYAEEQRMKQQEHQRQHQHSAAVVTSLMIVSQACTIEMVCRTIKGFARVDLDNQRAMGKNTIRDRLDVFNRLAKLCVSKNREFWQEHVLPGIALKYKMPVGEQEEEGDGGNLCPVPLAVDS